MGVLQAPQFIITGQLCKKQEHQSVDVAMFFSARSAQFLLLYSTRAEDNGVWTGTDTHVPSSNVSCIGRLSRDKYSSLSL